MRKITISLFTILSLTSFGQSTKFQAPNSAGLPNRGCGTMEAYEQEIINDPLSLEIRRQIEAETENWLKNNAGSKSSQAVINIPVVFHVVYNGTTENVSDAQIMDQLRILNEDLRKLNPDTGKVPAVWKSIAADCQVNLCLAQRDPSGNPTTGITRTATTKTSFPSGNDMKYTSLGGKDVWNRDQYLNIWVCDLGSSLLGFAQFPGGSAATDGVVIHYKYTGSGGATFPYDKGRTLTHELGHWLNLRHIWGDDSDCSGSDAVTDTPNQEVEHYGCYPPGSVQTDACATVAPGAMWQNYMDYTDDACMYMFTNGQKNRIQSLLTTGARKTLATSLGCVPIATLDGSITAILNPTGGNCNSTFSPVVTLTNKGTDILTSVIINYNVDGGIDSTFNWTGSLASGDSIEITLTAISTTSGTHIFNASTNAPNGGADQLTVNDGKARSFTIIASASPLPMPFFEGFQTTGFPPVGWTLINPNSNNKWIKVAIGGFGLSSACAKMDNISGSINLTGQTDDLVSPAINLSGGNSTLQVKFNVAYARYSDAYFDSLFIDISEDCGNTWSRFYGKGGTDLETRSATTSAFTPSAIQWRTDSVSMSAYAGLSDVRMRFRNLSGSGNNLYIDDINFSNAPVITGIREVSNNDLLSISPNPSEGIFNIQYRSAIMNLTVYVYNSIGKLVKTAYLNNNNSNIIDLSQEASGVYYLVGKYDGGVITEKILIVK